MGGQSTLASKLYDILYGAGYALDTPGAYMRGLMAGTPGERASGRDVIDSWGVMSPNRAGWHWDDLGDMAGDVGGFAIDTFLDPLNLIPIGWLGKVLRGAGKAADAVNAANHATAIADAAKAADYVRALEQHRISRGMGEIVDEVLEGSSDALRRIEGVPLGYEPKGIIEHYPNGRNFAEDQLLENELLLKPYKPWPGVEAATPHPIGNIRQTLMQPSRFGPLDIPPPRPEYGQLLPQPSGPNTTEAAIALAALFGQQALARSQNFLPVMNPLNQYPDLP